jgi:hypothetical protein
MRASRSQRRRTPIPARAARFGGFTRTTAAAPASPRLGSAARVEEVAPGVYFCRGTEVNWYLLRDADGDGDGDDVTPPGPYLDPVA